MAERAWHAEEVCAEVVARLRREVVLFSELLAVTTGVETPKSETLQEAEQTAGSGAFCEAISDDVDIPSHDHAGAEEDAARRREIFAAPAYACCP